MAKDGDKFTKFSEQSEKFQRQYSNEGFSVYATYKEFSISAWNLISIINIHGVKQFPCVMCFHRLAAKFADLIITKSECIVSGWMLSGYFYFRALARIAKLSGSNASLYTFDCVGKKLMFDLLIIITDPWSRGLCADSKMTTLLDELFKFLYGVSNLEYY